jgi:hypothetical protein
LTENHFRRCAVDHFIDRTPSKNPPFVSATNNFPVVGSTAILGSANVLMWAQTYLLQNL